MSALQSLAGNLLEDYRNDKIASAIPGADKLMDVPGVSGALGAYGAFRAVQTTALAGKAIVEMGGMADKQMSGMTGAESAQYSQDLAQWRAQTGQLPYQQNDAAPNAQTMQYGYPPPPPHPSQSRGPGF